MSRMVRAGPVEAAPEHVAGARAAGADIGVAVVAVDAPGLDAAVGVAVLAGPADVVHDAVAPLEAAGPHLRGDLGEGFFPGDTLPLALAAGADALERVEDAFRVVDLIVGGRPLGAVAPAAARVLRVALELLDLQRFLVHVGQQAACALAIEADRGDQHVAAGHPLGPRLAVPLRPVVPVLGWRVAGEAAVGLAHGDHLYVVRGGKAGQGRAGNVGDALDRRPGLRLVRAQAEHRGEEVGEGAFWGHGLGGWLVGWLAGWLVGWVVGWLAGDTNKLTNQQTNKPTN